MSGKSDSPKSDGFTERPLRVALFGAGGFASNHVEMVEKLQAEGLVRFMAVADPTVERLGELKARLEAEGIRWFPDYKELLAAAGGELDAVVISTPIPLHLPMLEAALGHNLAVFLEKPPVPLIQDFHRMRSMPGIGRVAVGFKLIADPALWRLKQTMLSGELGKVRRIGAMACWPRLDSYYGRASWAGRMVWHGMPVLDGPATNALAHIIHNLMFLGGENADAFAVPREIRAELYRARPIETYDLCCLRGRWDSGIEFSAAFTHAVEERVDWAIDVEGENGSALLTLDGLTFSGADDVPSGSENETDLFRACWLDFHALANARIAKPLTSFDDCLGYALATNAMFLSSGRIHSLPAPALRRFEREDDGGFDIPGIAGLAAEVAKTGRLFSELGVPWAVPGKPVDTVALTELPLEQFLPAAI